MMGRENYKLKQLLQSSQELCQVRMRHCHQDDETQGTERPWSSACTMLRIGAAGTCSLKSSSQIARIVSTL